MRNEFKVENIKVVVTDMQSDTRDENKYFITRDLENGTPMTEGVITIIKAFETEDGRVFYGYFYNGYNFMMKKEFAYEDVLQKEELQNRIRKYRIDIK